MDLSRFFTLSSFLVIGLTIIAILIICFGTAIWIRMKKKAAGSHFLWSLTDKN
ncbi:hypothetical protein [Phocaeicola plebeius]|uniref:hypothetical protein n=1 Tax=Phocaeicola plebeius TaxID=310297 RepID=UPI0026EBA21E|nr:hypothetical protein [Phocaeicola plebeius]